MTKELLEKAKKVIAEMPPTRTDGHPQAGEPRTKTKMFSPAVEKKPTAKAKPVKTDGVGAVAKKLILAGKTNAQVLEALGKQFGEKDFAVGGSKRYYSCWYRAALVRAGELKAVRS